MKLYRILPLFAFLLALASPVVWAAWPAGGLYPPARGPCLTSVWNSADKSATITLDDCAITATDAFGAGAHQIGVRSANFQSTGKYYWEETVPTSLATSSGIGFSDATPSLGASLGSTATGWGYFPATGNVINNGGTSTTIATGTAGQRVDFAVDLSTQHCWIRVNGGNWNNNASGNPATDTIPFFCNRFANLYAAYGSATNTSATTANFNPAAANVPSGFTAGIPAGGTAYVAGHTWSPLDMGAKLTVSNGRLTATGNTAGTTTSAVRSALSVSSGLYYWEITATAITSGQTGFGIADATQSLTTFLGSTGNHSIGWETGGVFRNGASVGSAGTFANGDNLGFALDMTNSKIHFRKNCGNWNNTVGNDPVTNTGGFSISALTGPFYAAANQGGSANSWTANFGGSAFNCTAPTGFTAGP